MVSEIRVRVGPKGRVVIPKTFQDALKIGPGSEVIFALEGAEASLRPSRTDVVDVFERIARSAKSKGQVRPHAAYERELRKRRKRSA
ncbi:MAG TPA: AbrB/MazE/SpoVT family DNA-binding domain-containing protein [Thermoplasmata archaeon]|nr:AbrB/MazE/SpoVT family DNA-binding domain-containing protein [Thermoplasmata archaeon]